MRGIRKVWAVTGAAMLLFAAACGGDADEEQVGDAGDDPVVAEAIELVEENMAVISEWPGPTDSPPMVDDKLVVVVPCAMAAEGCARAARGFIEAAEAVGWRTQLIDPEGDVDRMNSAIEQGVTLGADGIFLQSIDPRLVSGAISTVADAGIPVITNASAIPPEETEGVVHEISAETPLQGNLLGAYIVANTDGDAKIAMYNDPGFEGVVDYYEQSRDWFDRCSGCDLVGGFDFAVTDLGTPLESRAAADLQANPDIDVVWVGYDSAAAIIIPAIQTAGIADQLWGVASFGGNEQTLEFIRQGQVQRVTVAQANEWWGWAALDNFNRIFNGEDPVEDNVPVKLMDESNLPPAGEDWQGDLDFRSEYKDLWGVN